MRKYHKAAAAHYVRGVSPQCCMFFTNGSGFQGEMTLWKVKKIPDHYFGASNTKGKPLSDEFITFTARYIEILVGLNFGCLRLFIGEPLSRPRLTKPPSPAENHQIFVLMYCGGTITLPWLPPPVIHRLSHPQRGGCPTMQNARHDNGNSSA